MKIAKMVVVAISLLMCACNGRENTLTGPSNGAMLAVAGASSTSSTSSTSSGRGRTRSAPSTPELQAEGQVKSVSATSLTITDSRRGDMTFVLTPSTIIRKGQQPVAATALVAGDRVHVKGTKDGDTLTARLVIVEDTEGENEPSEFEGIVKAIAADSLTLTTPGGEIVLTLNVKTQFVPAAPVAGDRVHVRADRVSGSLVALIVVVQGQEDHGQQRVEVNGIVSAISSSSMTVRTSSKGDVALKIDAKTVFHPAAPKSGDRVEVKAVMKDGSLLAVDVKVEEENSSDRH